ncbi:prephenate dehydrogenase [Streptomyces sp. SID14515]|uniref:prephenate dehydrogenase n=2 Tax=unclassified Streptomyces TaxID=2593676 RepID=UPI0013C9EB01|nr:prephenate dehydrogenase [Streptomyces sp. SID14515]NEB42186.1 prephenate dehydrogenase [Streptomyces sp. SID14515]
MRTVKVIGTGLIGTSIALALTRRGVKVHLDDEDTTAARTAEAMGAGTLEEPREPVDLAVLSVPPTQVASLLTRVQRARTAHAYTDIASVKGLPRDEILAAGADPVTYVGGHPLASEGRPSPLAARPDLFEGRWWVLTPSEASDRSVLNRVLELVALCEGVPVIMDTERHDLAVALTTHAPHLIATLMAARLVDVPDNSVRLSGHGLRHVTRVAAGDPEFWRDVLEANADAVADVLDAYAADLGEAVGALRGLRSPDHEVRGRAAAGLDDLLERGNEGQARVAHWPGAPPRGVVSVPVIMPDRPGALARLFSAVGKAGVNIEDVRIDHAPEQPRGLIEIFVDQQAAPGLSRLLSVEGWALPDADVLVTDRH